MRERSNQAISGVPVDILMVAVVVLAATASYGLGYFAGKGSLSVKGGGFWIEQVGATTSARLPAAAAAAEASAPVIPIAAPGAILTPQEGKYVASKNGKKYYLPSCSGASRIKEENKVWFASIEEARASGRTPASNCPGL